MEKAGGDAGTYLCKTQISASGTRTDTIHVVCDSLSASNKMEDKEKDFPFFERGANRRRENITSQTISHVASFEMNT